MRLTLLVLWSFSRLAFSQDWTSLFDGRTLNGWHVEARPEDAAKNFWKAEDRTILCNSLGQPDHDYVWLVSDRDFGDFELRLEVRSFRTSPGN